MNIFINNPLNALGEPSYDITLNYFANFVIFILAIYLILGINQLFWGEISEVEHSLIAAIAVFFSTILLKRCIEYFLDSKYEDLQIDAQRRLEKAYAALLTLDIEITREQACSLLKDPTVIINSKVFNVKISHLDYDSEESLIYFDSNLCKVTITHDDKTIKKRAYQNILLQIPWIRNEILQHN